MVHDSGVDHRHRRLALEFIGIIFEHCLEIGDRFINASFFGQSNTQVRPCHWIFGGDVEGNLELIDRFVQAAMVKLELPQSGVRDKVV